MGGVSRLGSAGLGVDFLGKNHASGRWFFAEKPCQPPRGGRKKGPVGGRGSVDVDRGGVVVVENRGEGVGADFLGVVGRGVVGGRAENEVAEIVPVVVGQGRVGVFVKIPDGRGQGGEFGGSVNFGFPVVWLTGLIIPPWGENRRF